MGIEHLTVVTCDCCKTASRYDAGSGSDREWESDYAMKWPAEVTPFTQSYIAGHALPSTVVCASCLTEAEREQLADTQLWVQARSELPF